MCLQFIKQFNKVLLYIILYITLYLKPKETLQPISIRFTVFFFCFFFFFCLVKFKNYFNDIKEESFMHMIHIC